MLKEETNNSFYNKAEINRRLREGAPKMRHLHQKMALPILKCIMFYRLLREAQIQSQMLLRFVRIAIAKRTTHLTKMSLSQNSTETPLA